MVTAGSSPAPSTGDKGFYAVDSRGTQAGEFARRPESLVPN